VVLPKRLPTTTTLKVGSVVEWLCRLQDVRSPKTHPRNWYIYARSLLQAVGQSPGLIDLRLTTRSLYYCCCRNLVAFRDEWIDNWCVFHHVAKLFSEEHAPPELQGGTMPAKMKRRVQRAIWFVSNTMSVQKLSLCRCAVSTMSAVLPWMHLLTAAFKLIVCLNRLPGHSAQVAKYNSTIVRLHRRIKFFIANGERVVACIQ
jgi:hypothetical protein